MENVDTNTTSRMTEYEFWDKFNLKHNPQFYDKLKKSKTKEKKTEKKKTSRANTTKRHPVFKVPD